MKGQGLGRAVPYRRAPVATWLRSIESPLLGNQLPNTVDFRGFLTLEEFTTVWNAIFIVSRAR